MTTSNGIEILRHYILDGCQVNVADVAPLAAPGALDDALSRLSHYRRDKTLRYRFERGKMLSAGAGLLLDDMLMGRGLRERDMRYVEGEHGKPSLEQYPHLHFSLSHSGTLVVARESLVNYTLSDDEKAMLRALDGPDAQNAYFTQLWTLKECYAKATGTGLTHDFPSFAVVDGQVRALSPLSPPARFFVFSVDGARGAVAML